MRMEVMEVAGIPPRKSRVGRGSGNSVAGWEGEGI